VKRKDVERLKAIIAENNPTAFYSIEDIRVANQGVFPTKNEFSSPLDHIRRAFPDPKEK
jgi:hypothetical protein